MAGASGEGSVTSLALASRRALSGEQAPLWQLFLAGIAGLRKMAAVWPRGERCVTS